MYGKKPVISCAAGIEPAHPTARIICISGSLGRSLLVRVATLLAAFSPAAAISNPRNAPRIDECANARPQCCALPISPLPFRSRRWARATIHASHCGAPLPFPTHRGLRSLRSRAPRHAFHLKGAPCVLFTISGYLGRSSLARLRSRSDEPLRKSDARAIYNGACIKIAV